MEISVWPFLWKSKGGKFFWNVISLGESPQLRRRKNFSWEKNFFECEDLLRIFERIRKKYLERNLFTRLKILQKPETKKSFWIRHMSWIEFRCQKILYVINISISLYYQINEINLYLYVFNIFFQLCLTNRRVKENDRRKILVLKSFRN